MTVLGQSKDGYICEVSHTEVEKFLGLYYGKKDHMRVGDVVDLGSGYDWASKVGSALSETKRFVEANQPIIQSLMSGYSILANLGKAEE